MLAHLREILTRLNEILTRLNPFNRSEDGEAQGRLSLSGSDLKLIAVIFMTIDHIAMVFFSEGTYPYIMSRAVGRLAFPIFAFLLTIGIDKTRNIFGYLKRLFLFALISEIPYDLIHPGEDKCNIFFTLFLSAAAILCSKKIAGFCNGDKVSIVFLRMALHALILPVFASISGYFHTDYEFIGVVNVYVMYWAYRECSDAKAGFLSAATYLYDTFESPAIVAFIPIRLYNGERGNLGKWFFYIYYPLHLILLYLLKIYL